jgi:hypothetical protein
MAQKATINQPNSEINLTAAKIAIIKQFTVKK